MLGFVYIGSKGMFIVCGILNLGFCVWLGFSRRPGAGPKTPTQQAGKILLSLACTLLLFSLCPARARASQLAQKQRSERGRVKFPLLLHYSSYP